MEQFPSNENFTPDLLMKEIQSLETEIRMKYGEINRLEDERDLYAGDERKINAHLNELEASVLKLKDTQAGLEELLHKTKSTNGNGIH